MGARRHGFFVVERHIGPGLTGGPAALDVFVLVLVMLLASAAWTIAVRDGAAEFLWLEELGFTVLTIIGMLEASRGGLGCDEARWGAQELVLFLVVGALGPEIAGGVPQSLGRLRVFLPLVVLWAGVTALAHAPAWIALPVGGASLLWLAHRGGEAWGVLVKRGLQVVGRVDVHFRPLPPRSPSEIAGAWAVYAIAIQVLCCALLPVAVVVDRLA